MDADGFALQNLDHLFFIDLGGTQIAAPQGYWFKNYGLFKSEDKCFLLNQSKKRSRVQGG